MPKQALFFLPILIVLCIALFTDSFSNLVDKSGMNLSENCTTTAPKFCKSNEGNGCAKIDVSMACGQQMQEQIKTQCGRYNAAMYDTEAACTTALTSQHCPASFQDLTAQDVPGIAQCGAIQPELCKQACGARYDKVSQRYFGEQNGKTGITCSDDSLEAVKNGVALADDAHRKNCWRLPKGAHARCTMDHIEVNNIRLGLYVSCEAILP